MCKRSPSTVTLRTLYCAGLSNTSTAYLRKLEWNKLNMVLACFSSLEPDFVHRFASALICSRRRENLSRRRERERERAAGGGREVRTAIRWMSLSNDLCSANGSRTSRHCLCHCEGMLTYKMLILLRHCKRRACLHTFRSIAQQCIS